MVQMWAAKKQTVTPHIEGNTLKYRIPARYLFLPCGAPRFSFAGHIPFESEQMDLIGVLMCTTNSQRIRIFFAKQSAITKPDQAIYKMPLLTYLS